MTPTSGPSTDTLFVGTYVFGWELYDRGKLDAAYPTPLASAAEQLYLAGRRAGLGRADDSSLIQILRGTATAST